MEIINRNPQPYQGKHMALSRRVAPWVKCTLPGYVSGLLTMSELIIKALTQL